MSLSRLYVEHMEPHTAFRFVARFYPASNLWQDNQDIDNVYKRLQYTVKSIELPQYKIDRDKLSRRFQGTQLAIPVIDFSKTELSAVFEETDDMLIQTALNIWISTSPFDYGCGQNTPIFYIHIAQFDYTMHNIIDENVYLVQLKSYDLPDYNRTSFGEPVSYTIRFNVIYTYNSLEEAKNTIFNGYGNIDYTIKNNMFSNDTAADSVEQEIRQERLKQVIEQKQNSLSILNSNVSKTKEILTLQLDEITMELNRLLTYQTNSDSTFKSNLDAISSINLLSSSSSTLDTSNLSDEMKQLYKEYEKTAETYLTAQKTLSTYNENRLKNAESIFENNLARRVTYLIENQDKFEGDSYLDKTTLLKEFKNSEYYNEYVSDYGENAFGHWFIENSLKSLSTNLEGVNMYDNETIKATISYSLENTYENKNEHTREISDTAAEKLYSWLLSPDAMDESVRNSLDIISGQEEARLKNDMSILEHNVSNAKGALISQYIKENQETKNIDTAVNNIEALAEKQEKIKSMISYLDDNSNIEISDNLVNLDNSISNLKTVFNNIQKNIDSLTIPVNVSSTTELSSNSTVSDLIDYSKSNNLFTIGKNDTVTQWEKRITQDVAAGKIKDKSVAIAQMASTLNRVVATNNVLEEKGYSFKIKLAGTTDSYGSMMGVHGETSNHNSVNGGSKVDVGVYDEHGNKLDLTNTNVQKMVLNALRETDLWGTGVVENGSWIDLDTKGRYGQNTNINPVNDGDKSGDWTSINGNLINMNDIKIDSSYNTKTKKLSVINKS